jgi:hypothetical protein
MTNPERLARAARAGHGHDADANAAIREYLAANPKPAYTVSAAPLKRSAAQPHAWRVA